MMADFKIGDLVRDKLNKAEISYGLGIIVDIAPAKQIEEDYPKYPEDMAGQKRYSVYFNKFNKVMMFHGDYLEKVG